MSTEKAILAIFWFFNGAESVSTTKNGYKWVVKNQFNKFIFKANIIFGLESVEMCQRSLTDFFLTWLHLLGIKRLQQWKNFTETPHEESLLNFFESFPVAVRRSGERLRGTTQWERTRLGRSCAVRILVEFTLVSPILSMEPNLLTLTKEASSWIISQKWTDFAECWQLEWSILRQEMVGG